MADLARIIGQKITNLDITAKRVYIYTDLGSALVVKTGEDDDEGATLAVEIQE